MFLHVEQVKKHTAMRELYAKHMWKECMAHDGSVFFDLCIVQKSVTQIIYLGPLLTACESRHKFT